jgi:hypothetical protein
MPRRERAMENNERAFIFFKFLLKSKNQNGNRKVTKDQERRE